VRPQENVPELLKSVQVMVRFMLRMAILLGFGLLGSASFAQSMVALLWMAAMLCVVVATMRRELPFRTELNHWDEMTAYLALCSLASTFALPVPT
jgi:hypothetical protein